MPAQTNQILKAFAAPQDSSRRLIGLGFVAALHVALIFALMQMGVVEYVIKHVTPDLTMVDVKPDHPPPPPPPPTGDVSDPDTTLPRQIEPIIDYDTEAPPGPGGINVGPGEPQQGVTAGARGLMNTHTIPPYPTIAVRLGEEGVVSLRLMVSESGTVTNAVVIRTSGHQRLDDAAVAWVKAHWRYQPAMQGGRAVAAATNAQVKFELH